MLISVSLSAAPLFFTAPVFSATISAISFEVSLKSFASSLILYLFVISISSFNVRL